MGEDGCDSPLVSETHSGKASGAFYIHSPLTKLVALPVIPIPSLPCAKKEVGHCVSSSCPQSLVSPHSLSDLWSRPLFESSQDRGSCLPHSKRGLCVPSQVSVCLPHKGAVRPSTEPQERGCEAQMSVRQWVSVKKSRSSRAARRGRSRPPRPLSGGRGLACILLWVGALEPAVAESGLALG